MVQSFPYAFPNLVAWHSFDTLLSDVMKFHHLGQLLLDTNCLLLVMKMFGMQDVSTTVISKADWSDEKYAFIQHAVSYHGLTVIKLF